MVTRCRCSGIWQVPEGPECVNAVRWALEFGYWHVDNAQAYQNEPSVGKALKDSGVDRNDVFITTNAVDAVRWPQVSGPVRAMLVIAAPRGAAFYRPRSGLWGARTV
jgi:aryl-alcohol dehydrogenase-like predicted oxidoreductase